MPTTNRELFFDAVEFWKDKEYKKWVVVLSSSRKQKRNRDVHYIQARTAERAIEVAKNHCISLKGKIYGTARLAEPSDLGVKE